MEDWPALLNGLAADPLTNTIARLAAVRALFETGRLPEELFAWVHCPGPELLSTTDLEHHVGSAQVAETLLELGHLNAAERLAFDSLEMEGETPSVLRTLARLHVVKGLPDAAAIFLNRLQVYPEQAAWVGRLRAALPTKSAATADPIIARIQANLITEEGIAMGFTTEQLLRQALASHPENRMAFQFLMAHELLGRRLLHAQRALATSPQTREGSVSRHNAEALLLHHQLYPRISLDALLPRVPPAVAADFERFKAMLGPSITSLEQARPRAWREFGDTYWYYFFFGPLHQTNHPADPANP